MRKGLVVPVFALVMAGPTPAFAQQLVTLEQLRRELAPGDSISLVRLTGESITGRLVSIGDTDLAIRDDTVRPATGGRRRTAVSIPLDAIQTLERRRDSSRDGTLIGAGIGAGAAGALFVHALVIDRNELSEWAPVYAGFGAAFSAVGALIGWRVDSAHSKRHIKFDAALKHPSTTAQGSPSSRRCVGFRVALTF
jgi:hypothetical protein